jgi:formylglycine-generating enzyme required for sulfatase activity
MHLERFLAFKGKSLKEMEIESIIRQIASALDYAHQLALEDGYLIHGSLKLSNILIGKKENKYRAYLTDFGLYQFAHSAIFEEELAHDFSAAMQESNEGSEEKRLATLRSYYRNMQFLAPEQKEIARKEPIDAKTDHYAFGVLVYFMLTKTFPEGFFAFPSSFYDEMTLNWDLLIYHLLQKNPEKRPTYLIKAMDDFLHSKELPLQSPKNQDANQDGIFQMSFTFPGNNEKKSFSAISHEPLQPILKPGEIKRPQYDPDPAAIFQKETMVSRYQPASVEIKEVEPILTDMVVMPGGNYLRGSHDGARDEMPKHSIQLASFAIDVHPTTNEQFVRFLMAMGGEKDENNNDIIRLRDSRIKRNAGKLIIESGYAKHPVVGVTWYGAVAYAKWVGKRLPTEAEWEIASLGGVDAQVYPTGDNIERTQANFFSADTTTVMSYPANSYGLYDLAGNVYEWCQDWYAYNYYETSQQEPDNPKGPQQGVYRVLRGGCWKSLKEDLRCSHRHRNNPGAVNRTYGFRCAADVKPTE